MRISSVIAVAAALAAGCEPEPFTKCEGQPGLPQIDTTPTWHGDVRAIVEARCARCHNDGGLAPFALSSFDDVKEHLAQVKDAVETRRMPPWMPAKCCNKFRDDPSLTAEQIAIIRRWADDGAPEGDARAVGPPLDPVGSLSRVDATLVMNDAYLPDVAHADDTRCFMLDWPFDEKKFVTGFSVTPGARAQVHHALVLTAPDAFRNNYQILDDTDDEPGWSCPGGLIGGVDDYIGGWSPGWEGQEMPEGTGHKVDADDVVILTVHYSKPHTDVDIEPDQSSVDVRLEDSVDHELFSITVVDARWTLGGMPIAKGDDDVKYAFEWDPTDLYTFGRDVEIVGINLHMHERGKAGVVGIKRKSGDEECLVQVDDYDHAWQGDYLFERPTSLEDGDLVYLECHFDNSDGHQRIVDGVPEEPRDLNWAEDGEMCAAFITAKKLK